MSYKVAHIFFYGALSETLINYFNENFNRKKHVYFIYGKPEKSLDLKMAHNENIFYFNEVSYKPDIFEKIILDSNKVVIHALFNPYILQYFIDRPELIKKIVLVFWGGDIRTFFDDSPDMFTLEMNKLKEHLIKKVQYVATLVKGDYKQLETLFNIDSKYYEVSYPFLDGGANLRKTKIRSGINRSSVKIQIGNSATYTNRHIEVMELISKFYEKNIELYLPLSYGSKEYANSVIKKGYELFGEKFHPMVEYLPLKDYYNHLKRIDIAIFNNDRQQALFNIEASLLVGCKVFCRDDTPMWPFFTNDWNVYLNCVKDITAMCFDEFIYYDKIKAQNNHNNILKMIDNKRINKLWKILFVI